jgi:DNA-binding response OmpR family regulator
VWEMTCSRTQTTDTCGVSSKKSDQHLPLAGKTILVAEDEAMIGMDLCDQLAHAGAQTRLFDTNAAALNSLHTEKIDLAIVDNLLVDGPAEKLCGALRERAVPFIFHTGRSADETADLPEVVVSKPASFNLILKRLSELSA